MLVLMVMGRLLPDRIFEELRNEAVLVSNPVTVPVPDSEKAALPKVFPVGAIVIAVLKSPFGGVLIPRYQVAPAGPITGVLHDRLEWFPHVTENGLDRLERRTEELAPEARSVIN